MVFQPLPSLQVGFSFLTLLGGLSPCCCHWWRLRAGLVAWWEADRLECPSVCRTLLSSHSPWTPLQHLCPDFKCLSAEGSFHRALGLGSLKVPNTELIPLPYAIGSVSLLSTPPCPWKVMDTDPMLLPRRGHGGRREGMCDMWHTCCVVLSGHLSCGSCILSAVCPPS